MSVAFSVSTTLSPLNGRAPDTISNIVTPSANRLLRTSASLAQDLFRCDIPRRAGEARDRRVGQVRRYRPGCGLQPGQAEIENLYAAIGADEHIVRLQVAVDDSARVRGRKSTRHLQRHGRGLRRLPAVRVSVACEGSRHRRIPRR